MLQVCDILWGSAEIIDAHPAISLIQNGLYLPYRSGESWGIYDGDGQIVRLATDFRERVKPSHNQVTNPVRICDYDLGPDVGGVLIYGGYINLHYGHFIVNSLPRLWNIAQIKTPSTKILCHGVCQPKEWFAFPFIAAIMEVLGLRPDDFVCPSYPVRLPALVVPGTSLHEQAAGHRVYGSFCREIGRRLLHGRTATRGGQFAYFSKSQLRSAVGLIENELEIDDSLRARGVDIIYPELLSLRDQVGIFIDYDCILGTSGSFFHTSIFTEETKLACLNVTAQINTNYTIIDCLANNDAVYLYPPAIRVAAERAGVMTTRYLPDAAHVAEEFLLTASR